MKTFIWQKGIISISQKERQRPTFNEQSWFRPIFPVLIKQYSLGLAKSGHAILVNSLGFSLFFHEVSFPIFFSYSLKDRANVLVFFNAIFFPGSRIDLNWQYKWIILVNALWM